MFHGNDCASLVQSRRKPRTCNQTASQCIRNNSFSAYKYKAFQVFSCVIINIVASHHLSLPLFPFLIGEVLPATSSPPHLISSPPSSIYCLLLPVFLLACLPHIFVQSSHLSLGLSQQSVCRDAAAMPSIVHRPLLDTHPSQLVSVLSSILTVFSSIKDH